jgi:pseudomonalisin/xanthomonalisin
VLSKLVTVSASPAPPPPPPPPSGSVAYFIYSCTGFSCNFDGTPSQGATSYSWNFGDGGTGGVAIHPHTFAPGTYIVTLTTQPSGPSSSFSKTIDCTSSPCK